jgi:hypothetical protein
MFEEDQQRDSGVRHPDRHLDGALCHVLEMFIGAEYASVESGAFGLHSCRLRPQPPSDSELFGLNCRVYNQESWP